MTVELVRNGQSVAAATTSSTIVGGQVRWWNDEKSQDSGRGAGYSAVKARSTTGKGERIVCSDSEGRFAFPDLPPGEWVFVAMHDRGLHRDEKRETIAGRREDLVLMLYRRQVIDNDLGWRYFSFLLVALCSIALLYIIVHAVLPAAPRSLHLPLEALVAQTIDTVRSAEQLPDQPALAEQISEIRRLGTGLTPPNGVAFSASEQQEINALLGQIEAAIAQNDRPAALLRLLRFQYLLRNLQPAGFFWHGEPWRYLEVLFWSLLGVLCSQVIATATYVRQGTYLRNAQILRVAQLAIGPLVSLIFVLFLSLATFQLTFDSGQTVQLNVTNPETLTLVSFVLGLSFWNLWDWLSGAFERTFGTRAAAQNPRT
jgi:hypothetical protein